MMDAKDSVLLIVDVQQNLAPVMSTPREVLRGCSLLMRAAARLDIPTLVSEQYPKGLGSTMGELLELAPPDSVVEKMHFSCAAEPSIRSRMDGLDKKQVVIAGIEAHVCVLQSALGFRQAGYQVFVIGDACSSRTPANHQAALARMAQAGVTVATVEMAVFEWLHVAGTPQFKDLSRLIR